MFKRQLTSISRALIGFTGLCLSTLLPIAAYGQGYNVEINKTKILQLPAPAAAVIVGNPAIADISVHSPTMLFMIGRGYGVTNVIVLDELGQTIMNADIQVGNNTTNSGMRVLFAGKGSKSYDCNPFCQPSPVLGDDPMFVAQFKGQGQAINNTNTPITTTQFTGQLIPELQQLGATTRAGFGRGSSEY